MPDPTANGSFDRGFGQVQARFDKLTGDQKTRAEGYARQAHGSLSDFVSRAADALDGALDRAPDQVRTNGRKATEFARAKPLITTLALGAAALLLTRGGRRR